MFFVGIGAGAGAAIFGYLAHTSTNKERTAFFSVFMAAGEFGLILGEPLGRQLEPAILQSLYINM